MDLCKDCAHCMPKRSYYFHELGSHVSVDYSRARCALTDVVTGSGSAGRFCVDERAIGGDCGTRAANFTPKPPEPVLVKPERKRRWWQL